jgi:hypothetical protein
MGIRDQGIFTEDLAQESCLAATGVTDGTLLKEFDSLAMVSHYSLLMNLTHQVVVLLIRSTIILKSILRLKMGAHGCVCISQCFLSPVWCSIIMSFLAGVNYPLAAIIPYVSTICHRTRRSFRLLGVTLPSARVAPRSTWVWVEVPLTRGIEHSVSQIGYLLVVSRWLWGWMLAVM